jgi:hypothetical protein
MGAEQDSLNQPTNPEQGSNSALLDESSLVERLHRTLEDRGATEEQRRALLDNPRVRTLYESGQLDIASSLYREEATGTTELPRVKPPKRKPVNRRGGRSRNEGSDSEHDPNWTEPASALPFEEAERGHKAARALAEEMRQERVLREFTDNKAKLGEMQALAILRAQGYRPDPNSKGTTLVKLEEETPRVPFKDRRPSRKRY